MNKLFKKENILSLISGLIGTIPFILIYVFGNYILSILSFIVPYSVFYIYKKNKNTLEKSDYIYIFIISIISITVSSLLLIPLLIILKNSYEISLNSFLSMYTINGFAPKLINGLLLSYDFILFGSFYIYKGTNKFNKKEIICLVFITIIILLCGIFTSNNDSYLKKFNLEYKTQEVKINNDLSVYIPDYFYEYKNNEYRLHDMKSGSSNYINSVIKCINIDFLNDYEYYSYEEMKDKKIKNGKATNLGSNLLIEGKDKDNYYFDYYIKDYNDTIYIRFITKDNNKLTKEAVNKIVESVS